MFFCKLVAVTKYPRFKIKKMRVLILSFSTFYLVILFRYAIMLNIYYRIKSEAEVFAVCFVFIIHFNLYFIFVLFFFNLISGDES